VAYFIQESLYFPQLSKIRIIRATFEFTAEAMIKKLAKIITSLLAAYFTVCLGFWFFQDKLIFQPDKLDQAYVFQFNQPFQEFFIQADGGNTLNVLLFKTTQPTKGLILYFHGNADNLQRWGQYAVDLTSLGYDVLMPEYRGYGKSSGKPGEQEFYADAETVLNWAKQNFYFERLIFYGRSLGSGVASHLAMHTTPDLLILETPFNDLHGVIYPPIKPLLWFLPLNATFSNAAHLKKVSCKKIIIHGTDDWVVPLSSAKRLKPLLSGDDVFVVIEDGSHKDLRKFKEYHAILRDALQ
jgi:uncharacterized protein